jgi:hypothetical protein
MAGRLPVRSLVRLSLMAGLAASAGLCTFGGTPGVHAYATVSDAVHASLLPGVTEPGWLATGSKAGKATGHRGPAAYPATPSRDLRGVPHPFSASPSVAVWSLALHAAWAPLRVEHASRLARVAGGPAGRAPPASAGF